MQAVGLLSPAASGAASASPVSVRIVDSSSRAAASPASASGAPSVLATVTL